MLILQIRQAEVALENGRLDEAFELVRQEDVRAHRHGQRLIDRLVQALVARGREHLAAARLTQASADHQKARSLGGNLAEIAALQAAIDEAARLRQKQDRRHADAVAAAREHIENGRLSMGECLLADVGSGTRARGLREQAAARRATAEAALARARDALDQDDLLAAVDALLEARGTHTSNPSWTDLTRRVVDLVTSRAGDAIDQGRLDLAASMLHRLGPLASRNLPAQEMQRIIEQCRLAAGSVERGEFHRALQVLRQVTAIRPGAQWARDESANLQQAADSLERLRGGPLGLLQAAVPCPAAPGNHAETEVIPRGRASGITAPGPRAASGLPSRFVIRVDGVGSYLVLRERRITMGPAGSSRHPDLGLLADSGLPVTTIERCDEDYFLTADAPVRVNDVPTTRKLLADGDQIALASRCGMKFTVPNAASTSAVVNMSGTRLPHGDVRRVILLDKSVIIGPSSSAHIRAETLSDAAVLHVRDGRLFCRTTGPVTVDDRPMDRHGGIPMNAHVKIGPLSMVVTES